MLTKEEKIMSEFVRDLFCCVPKDFICGGIFEA